MRTREVLNALTYIDVLKQQFVGHSILVEKVVIDRAAGDGGPKKEAEHSRYNQISLTYSSTKIRSLRGKVLFFEQLTLPERRQ